jgi:hypothetical protein
VSFAPEASRPFLMCGANDFMVAGKGFALRDVRLLSQLLAPLHFPQSSSASRFTMGAAGFLNFSQADRNFAFASSNVGAWPFVIPGLAGQIEVTDQNQRNSGGVLADASS